MILYDIAFIAFSIFYIPFSICKKGFRSFNLKYRFGFVPQDIRSRLTGSKNIWIHAVSVGETMVLAAFLEGLKETFGDYRIIISTTTKAGNEVAKRFFGGEAVIIYSPFDLSLAVKRFLNIIKPRALIIVETEIWPNLISLSKKYGVPVIVVNGRISARSFKRYLIARPIFAVILRKIDLFCMQSEADADRIVAIGAPQQRVKVTGNMKFDMVSDKLEVMSDKLYEKRKMLGLGEKDILLVAGSTHRGEEEILLEAYKDIKKDFLNLQLLIAPRHIERIPQIELLAKKKGFSQVRISNLKRCQAPFKKVPGTFLGAFLLDTIGQLKDFYRAADIVFIGGSLIPHGGQNPIEAAYFSKPIIFGPFMFNFSQIAQILLKNNAAIQINEKYALRDVLTLLINDDKRRLTMGLLARKAMEENRGASKNNIQLIKKIL